MAFQFPPCPPSLRPIQHYLKTASEHDGRDPVISYWCRIYALQNALKLDKKSDEAKLLLMALMDYLEKEKKRLSDNEAITNDVAAQAHIENYALKLFLWADGQDRAAQFNKNVVKAFYTAGFLMDVLTTFGELTEEIQQNCKYAKWKAAYIHNCLRNGETPVPGPLGGEEQGTEGGPSTSGQSQPSIGFESIHRPDQPTPTSSESSINDPSSTIHYPSPASIGSASTFNLPTPPSSDTNLPTVPPSHPFPSPYQQPPTQLSPYQQPTVPPSQPSPSPYQQPYHAPNIPPTYNPAAAVVNNTASKGDLRPEQISKAQKYCKWAGSALNYDDVPEAIMNLQKALKLLTTGEDS